MSDVKYMGSTQIAFPVLGASVFPTRILPPPGCISMQLKLISTGGTVQIMPNAISGASVGGATAAIAGYPLITGEMYPIPGPAAFYLGCSGATGVVAINFMFSANKGLDGNV